ncbi:hypothetical protein BOX17_00860 [Halomonas aestuarii]|uniref:DUF1330 domain-containing protein n=1 Tax=Halomonas aestuarii TaxID=1897729 RepID=A0A1J0VK66_9GAMM|nr:DUF1330 domain-containing protein [Halomonas aestuarii]APE32406.1 hypothetical protein BOX17_00860 [Halomonas aestuarii]
MSAYLVFNYRINDRDAYDPYLAAVPAILEAHGAEILAADFDSEAVEGDARHVTVVLKFPSKEAARGWYDSPEYQDIIGLRLDNCDGMAVLANGAGQ